MHQEQLNENDLTKIFKIRMIFVHSIILYVISSIQKNFKRYRFLTDDYRPYSEVILRILNVKCNRNNAFYGTFVLKKLIEIYKENGITDQIQNEAEFSSNIRPFQLHYDDIELIDTLLIRENIKSRAHRKILILAMVSIVKELISLYGVISDDISISNNFYSFFPNLDKVTLFEVCDNFLNNIYINIFL